MFYFFSSAYGGVIGHLENPSYDLFMEKVHIGKPFTFGSIFNGWDRNIDSVMNFTCTSFTEKFKSGFARAE